MKKSEIIIVLVLLLVLIESCNTFQIIVNDSNNEFRKMKKIAIIDSIGKGNQIESIILTHNKLPEYVSANIDDNRHVSISSENIEYNKTNRNIDGYIVYHIDYLVIQNDVKSDDFQYNTIGNVKQLRYYSIGLYNSNFNELLSLKYIKQKVGVYNAFESALKNANGIGISLYDNDDSGRINDISYSNHIKIEYNKYDKK